MALYMSFFFRSDAEILGVYLTIDGRRIVSPYTRRHIISRTSAEAFSGYLRSNKKVIFLGPRRPRKPTIPEFGSIILRSAEAFM